MMTSTTLKAYISQYCHLGPDDLIKNESISSLHFVQEGQEDYYVKNGYTHVGSAEITFTPLEKEKVVENKIEALRQECVGIRAEATAKVTRLESHIQKLLSIGFDDKMVFTQPSDESDIPF